MLYIADEIIKLGGILLKGMVNSVEITANAIIDEKKDDAGKLAAVQPLGYETAKVTVTMTLEDMPNKTTIEQLTDLQRLFKPEGQEQPLLLPIVNEDCAARGIHEVYFKAITSKKVTNESKRTATLELTVPQVAGIKVEKVVGEAAVATAVEEATAAIRYAMTTTKNFGNSPAVDGPATANALRAAIQCVA